MIVAIVVVRVTEFGLVNSRHLDVAVTLGRTDRKRGGYRFALF